jgi:hypothetical protein
VDRFLFAPFDPHALALFRVSLGALYLAFLIVSSPNWERFYAPDGMNGLHYHERTWSLFHLTADWLPVRAYWVLGVVAAIALTLGAATRLATVVLYALEVSLVNVAPQCTNGEDMVFRMALFWAAFMPLGACASVDARLRGAPTTVTPWATRGLQLNVALIYLISQPNKLLDDPAWKDGSAIYLTMASNAWTRWPWPSLFYGALSQLATWGSLAVELFFPLFVWFPRTRPWALGAIVALHVGIALTLANVTFFNLAMLATFWVFVPGETTRAWTTRLLHRVKT